MSVRISFWLVLDVDWKIGLLNGNYQECYARECLVAPSEKLLLYRVVRIRVLPVVSSSVTTTRYCYCLVL